MFIYVFEKVQADLMDIKVLVDYAKKNNIRSVTRPTVRPIDDDLHMIIKGISVTEGIRYIDTSFLLSKYLVWNDKNFYEYYKKGAEIYQRNYSSHQIYLKNIIKSFDIRIIDKDLKDSWK